MWYGQTGMGSEENRRPVPLAMMLQKKCYMSVAMDSNEEDFLYTIPSSDLRVHFENGIA
jgi:hypothetical protein